jgi:hypothetical protein
MIDAEQVDWVAEESVLLSDGGDVRPADQADLLAKAVTRPGIGRYGGRAMSAVRLRARAPTAVRAPATVALRTAAVAGGGTMILRSSLERLTQAGKISPGSVTDVASPIAAVAIRHGGRNPTFPRPRHSSACSSTQDRSRARILQTVVRAASTSRTCSTAWEF